MLQTIQKIGPVLDLFTAQRPDWGVTEVADAVGAPRSSAHALLTSLAETGLLQCRARGRYRLGWRVVELNEALRASVDLRAVAYPVLRRLADQYGETVHLAESEAVPDVSCVAAPIRDDLNVVVAAMSFATPSSRLSSCRVEYPRAVAAAAREISGLLAGGRLPRLATPTDEPAAHPADGRRGALRAVVTV
jgi:DNA-binding IclR family transcriptional regulator